MRTHDHTSPGTGDCAPDPRLAALEKIRALPVHTFRDGPNGTPFFEANAVLDAFCTCRLPFLEKPGEHSPYCTILAALDGWTLVRSECLIAEAFTSKPSDVAEIARLRKIEAAARAHGLCVCRYYPGYPRGDRHAPECDDDPDLRAALAGGQ